VRAMNIIVELRGGNHRLSLSARGILACTESYTGERVVFSGA
jgi:hypothetical protein